jgi:hypothetical protein
MAETPNERAVRALQERRERKQKEKHITPRAVAAQIMLRRLRRMSDVVHSEIAIAQGRERVTDATVAKVRKHIETWTARWIDKLSKMSPVDSARQ